MFSKQCLFVLFCAIGWWLISWIPLVTHATGSCLSLNTIPVTFNAPVSDVHEQANGKILVAWHFTTLNGVATNSKIIRLNSDFSLDTWFASGQLTINSWIVNIAQMSDGKIVVLGDFDGIWHDASDIAVLHTDGTIDTSFLWWFFWLDPWTAPLGGANVGGLAVDAGDNIVAGGDFAMYQWMPQSKLVRIDSGGAVDMTFPDSSVMFTTDAHINDVKIQPDGKILIWWWRLIGGDELVIRLNSDGTLDTTFTILSWALDEVASLTLQPDGKILVGGSFPGNPHGALIRLLDDGTVDTTFDTSWGGFTTTFVYDTDVAPNGDIYVAAWWAFN